ncbi:MAG TPA: SDR family NAD(P)-dependent oxidoreductase, partial [Candidatus Angelobacter sp.]|nr:SDR family NAD(P)-dependent oxidoreductase [Candidatus Angelobacter sp.]
MEQKTQVAAVVTGGSGGIGSALSHRLASDGFYVYLCCNGKKEAGEAMVAEIQSRGGD